MVTGFARGLSLVLLAVAYPILSVVACWFVARRGEDRLTQVLTASLWGGYTLAFWVVP